MKDSVGDEDELELELELELGQRKHTQLETGQWNRTTVKLKQKKNLVRLLKQEQQPQNLPHFLIDFYFCYSFSLNSNELALLLENCKNFLYRLYI